MIDVTTLVKAEVHPIVREQDFLEYWAYSAHPLKGLLYVTHNNHEFISGHIRCRGKGMGKYPYGYLEMIDNLFGEDKNTIEVCSYLIPKSKNLFTVDINPDYKPTFVCDGQYLVDIPSQRFTRWRCDPPYNELRARKMWNCELPEPIKLLKAGARVIKSGSLMFFMLGPKNYQAHPPSIKRIGMIILSIVPNNELRCVNIYLKL